jgi:DNA polymerase III epsilon subunit-like protein
MANSMVHWNGDQIAVVDVETTGNDPSFHEIWQICVLPLDSNLVPRKDVSAFLVEMKPNHPERAQQEAIAVSRDAYIKACQRGFDRERVKDMLRDWYLKLGLPFTAGGHQKRLIPLGQNAAAFDVPFIKSWLDVDCYSEIFSHAIRDTMCLALSINDSAGMRAEQIPFPKYNLRYLASKLGIEYTRHHHAMNDCLATAGVYKELLKYLMA